MEKNSVKELGNIAEEISQKEQKRQSLENRTEEIQKLGSHPRRSKVQIIGFQKERRNMKITGRK